MIVGLLKEGRKIFVKEKTEEKKRKRERQDRDGTGRRILPEQRATKASDQRRQPAGSSSRQQAAADTIYLLASQSKKVTLRSNTCAT